MPTLVSPSPLDLVTLAEVKASVGIDPTKTADDAHIQEAITGVSQYWLTRTGRGSLNQIVSYTERYDGTGTDSLLLRQWPVVSVLRLAIEGQIVPAWTESSPVGWMLNPEADCLILINRNEFPRGRMNILVSYQAGYDGTPDDIQRAVRQQVAQTLKRARTTDQASVSLPSGGGTTSYRDWEVEPEVERVINAYKRGIPY